MKINIREFKPEDKRKILELEREGLLPFFEKHVKGGLPISTEERWLNECLTFGFVETIEIEKKFVGFISCKPLSKGVLYVNGLHIKKEFQNNGIGQEVMMYLFEKAKNLKYKDMSLYVFKDNHVSLHLYEKWGFVFYRDIEEEYTFELRKKLN